MTHVEDSDLHKSASDDLKLHNVSEAHEAPTRSLYARSASERLARRPG